MQQFQLGLRPDWACYLICFDFFGYGIYQKFKAEPDAAGEGHRAVPQSKLKLAVSSGYLTPAGLWPVPWQPHATSAPSFTFSPLGSVNICQRICQTCSPGPGEWKMSSMPRRNLPLPACAKQPGWTPASIPQF